MNLEDFWLTITVLLLEASAGGTEINNWSWKMCRLSLHLLTLWTQCQHQCWNIGKRIRNRTKWMTDLSRHLDRRQPASGCRSSPCTGCEHFRRRCGCISPGRRPRGPPRLSQLNAERCRQRASSGRYRLRSSSEWPWGRRAGVTSLEFWMPSNNRTLVYSLWPLYWA